MHKVIDLKSFTAYVSVSLTISMSSPFCLLRRNLCRPFQSELGEDCNIRKDIRHGQGTSWERFQWDIMPRKRSLKWERFWKNRRFNINGGRGARLCIVRPQLSLV